MDKETKDYEVQQVDEADKIKDVLAEEQISKLDDEVHSKTRKNRKLKDKVKTRNVLIIILIIIIIILLLRSCSGVKDNSTKLPYPEFEKVVNELPDGIDDAVATDVDGAAFLVLDDITISKSSPNYFFANLKSNAGKYYIQFTLIDNDTSKVLYESKLVPPDSCIRMDTIKDLDIGSYNVSLIAQAYDYDNPYIKKNGASCDYILTIVE